MPPSPWGESLIPNGPRQANLVMPMRAAKVQASLRIRAVSPESSLLAHTSSESRGTFRQKARPLARLNGWACAVKICHDGMLEDSNLLDAAQIKVCNPSVPKDKPMYTNNTISMYEDIVWARTAFVIFK